MSSESEIKQSETVLPSNRLTTDDIATLQATVHTVIAQVDALENKVKKLEKQLAERDKTIKTMSGKITSLNLYTSRTDEEQKIKFDTMDSFRKNVSSTLRNVGDFDCYLNDLRLRNIETSIQSVTSQISVCNKQILSIKSYSSCVSPIKAQVNRTHEINNAGEDDEQNKAKLSYPHLDSNSACGNSNDINIIPNRPTLDSGSTPSENGNSKVSSHVGNTQLNQETKQHQKDIPHCKPLFSSRTKDNTENTNQRSGVTVDVIVKDKSTEQHLQ